MQSKKNVFYSWRSLFWLQMVFLLLCCLFFNFLSCCLLSGKFGFLYVGWHRVPLCGLCLAFLFEEGVAKRVSA
jgi:hypothetical protein